MKLQKDKFSNGMEVFNITTGEVMNYLGRGVQFPAPTKKNTAKGKIIILACGYDEFGRFIEWPYNETERV